MCFASKTELRQKVELVPWIIQIKRNWSIRIKKARLCLPSSIRTNLIWHFSYPSTLFASFLIKHLFNGDYWWIKDPILILVHVYWPLLCRHWAEHYTYLKLQLPYKRKQPYDSIYKSKISPFAWENLSALFKFLHL